MPGIDGDQDEPGVEAVAGTGSNGVDLRVRLAVEESETD
jgi:hypothetical protein